MCAGKTRPKIFGMSAAPAASSGRKQSAEKIRRSIIELQQNMDSQIVTVLQRAAVEEVAPPPQLITLDYPIER
jgi:hypothetical protein